MEEGRCKAFTTNRVRGCTGSEVRHAFEWHLIDHRHPSTFSFRRRPPTTALPPPRPHPQPPSHSHLPSSSTLDHLDITCKPPSQAPPSAPPPPPRTAESCYNKLADHEWCYEAGANTQGVCEAYFFERQYGCDAPRTQASRSAAKPRQQLLAQSPLPPRPPHPTVIHTHACKNVTSTSNIHMHISHQGWLPIMQVGERLLPCRRSHADCTDHVCDCRGAAVVTDCVLRHQPARRRHHQVLLPAERGHLDAQLCLLLPPDRQP